MNPRYPVYIISKNRWESRKTAKALDSMDVPYFIVVEASEYAQYKQVIEGGTVLVLDKKYQDDYEPMTHEDWKSNGPGAARNFCWDHSIDLGADSHWVLDDNIPAFGRVNQNRYAHVNSGTIFKAAEDFVDRYENVAISGFNYFKFVVFKNKIPAFSLNTRIYSCLLIRNDIPYRWRGRYNEDTDLSLRVLKDGWCTVQFNAFIQEKDNTQVDKGGNTEEFYAYEGTMNKSKLLAEMHPDVARVVRRFGRWHHYVDYSGFKKNKLIRKSGLDIPKGNCEYGLRKVKTNGKK